MKAIDRLRDVQDGIAKTIEREDESMCTAYDWAVLAQAVLDLDELIHKVARTANQASSQAYSIGRER